MIAAIRLLLLAVVLCYWGSKNLDHGEKEAKPVSVTAEQYLADVPKAGWYEIKGGTLSLLHARFKVRVGRDEPRDQKHSPRRAEALYLPVYTKDTFGTPTTLVLETKDETLRKTLAELDWYVQSHSKDESKAWLTKNRDRILLQRDLTGIISPMSVAEIKLLEFAGRDTAAKFMILREGERPMPPIRQNGLGLLITGGIFGAIGVVMLIGALKQRAALTQS